MKKYLFVLGIEAIACILFCIFGREVEGGWLGVLALPFKLLGDALRDMSLSTDAGNIIAIIIYAVICLIPLIVALVRVVKKKQKIEDILLVVLSASLFLIIYIMINPHYVSHMAMSVGLISAIKGVVAGVAYSIIVAYISIRVIRKVSVKDNNKNSENNNRLKKYLIPLLWFLAAVFVFKIFGTTFYSLLEGIESLGANYYESSYEEMLNFVMLVLEHIVDTIPSIIYIVMTIAFIKLIEKLDANNISESLVEDGKKMTLLCKVSICCTVLSNVAYNLLVLVFIKDLKNINGTIELPIFTIILALVVTVLAHFINDTKAIKEENDMFI